MKQKHKSKPDGAGFDADWDYERGRWTHNGMNREDYLFVNQLNAAQGLPPLPFVEWSDDPNVPPRPLRPGYTVSTR